MKDLSYSMITKDEEHSNQFSSKERAILNAKIVTTTTSKLHSHFLTITYRNLTPRICWAVVLKRHWVGEELVTA